MMNDLLGRLSTTGVACRRSRYLDSFSLKGTFRRAGMHFIASEIQSKRVGQRSCLSSNFK